MEKMKMKKNETYDIFVCISFSLAVICALSVFFENFISYNAIVFGVSLGSVWLRAVAAVILLATSTVSVKLRIDSKHGKAEKKTAIIAAKIIFPAIAVTVCANAVISVLKNGLSYSILPIVAAILSVIGHAVSLALIIKGKEGTAKFVFAVMTLSLVSITICFCADSGQKTISKSKRILIFVFDILLFHLVPNFLKSGNLWIAFALMIVMLALYIPELLSFYETKPELSGDDPFKKANEVKAASAEELKEYKKELDRMKEAKK